MLELTSGRFGPAFDPSDIQESTWGSVAISNIGCESIHTQWTPDDTRFDAGERTLTRLSSIEGLGC